ncbi:MAG: hypothetical protein ABSG53_18050 [Thermoguttaceae bacterium]|jgi:hypothetical protein
MANDDDTSLYFTDGYVATKTRIRIAAKLNAESEADFSRVQYLTDGEWSYDDIEDSVVSVYQSSQPRTCYWLGHNGTVTIVGGGKHRSETLVDVERYGYVNRIRNIGASLYVCGYAAQVYRREKEGVWTHMDEGILIKRPRASSVDLQDIDGTAEDDIYTVGTGGAIYHYDGRTWTQLDSPTNLHLLRVRCVSKDEVYISGSRGRLLRGNRNGWLDLGDPDVADDFWGLEYFRGKVYVAHANGIMVWNGEKLESVDMGIKRDISCHRLHANDGVLWSFGMDDLFFFDGKTWTEVVCPENVAD